MSSKSSQESAPTALGFFVLDDEGAFAIAWPALPLKRFDIITQQVAWTIRRHPIDSRDRERRLHGLPRRVVTDAGSVSSGRSLRAPVIPECLDSPVSVWVRRSSTCGHAKSVSLCQAIRMSGRMARCETFRCSLLHCKKEVAAKSRRS